ncbi:hypothetical protein K439DRAFT_1642311 [Ramaria rubella]|nr:hypothetical protein K439DRAFT_1642311 [Ramaria rubella]
MAAPDPGYARRPSRHSTSQNSPPSSVFSQPFLYLKPTATSPSLFIKPCTPTSSSLARHIKCTRATELAPPVFQPLNHGAHEIARHL